MYVLYWAGSKFCPTTMGIEPTTSGMPRYNTFRATRYWKNQTQFWNIAITNRPDHVAQPVERRSYVRFPLCLDKIFNQPSVVFTQSSSLRICLGDVTTGISHLKIPLNTYQQSNIVWNLFSPCWNPQHLPHVRLWAHINHCFVTK